MALWDSVSNNTAALAGAFADLMDKQATELALKMCPILVSAIGAGFTPGSGLDAAPSFKGSVKNKISGGRGSIVLAKDAPTFTGVAMTNAASAVTPAVTLDLLARPEFDHSLFKYTHWEATRNADTLVGENATVNYLSEVSKHITRGVFKTFAGEFHGTGDQTETTIGSWRRAIGANDSIGTYLGMQRAAAANASFRGNVYTNSGSGGALTLERMRTAINACRERTGRPDLAVMGAANYGVLQNDLQEFQYVIDHNNPYMKFGFASFMFDGVPVVLDGYCNADWVGIFDTDTWKLWFDTKGFNVNFGAEYPATQATIPMMVRFYASMVCDNPGHNAKIYTGSSFLGATAEA